MSKIFFLIILFSTVLQADVLNASFLSENNYQSLNTSQKKTYVQQVRQAFWQFEKRMLAKVKVADSEKVYPVQIFWDQAWADEGKCLIGGQVRDLVAGKCSTRNNQGNCEVEDAFQCGLIYENICITRTPIDTLSQRCLEGTRSLKVLDIEQYKKFVENGQKIFNDHCLSNVKNKDGCDALRERLKELGEKTKTPADSKGNPAPREVNVGVFEYSKTCKPYEKFEILCKPTLKSAVCEKGVLVCTYSSQLCRESGECKEDGWDNNNGLTTCMLTSRKPITKDVYELKDQDTKCKNLEDELKSANCQYSTVVNNCNNSGQIDCKFISTNCLKPSASATSFYTCPTGYELRGKSICIKKGSSRKSEMNKESDGVGVQ